ncbi:hypothetical protein BLOT_013283 [Blomia tropicalis]|nr:hypothetical protein BLOT_013283 [Blomia tropicalis]
MKLGSGLENGPMPRKKMIEIDMEKALKICILSTDQMTIVCLLEAIIAKAMGVHVLSMTSTDAVMVKSSEYTKNIEGRSPEIANVKMGQEASKQAISMENEFVN